MITSAAYSSTTQYALELVLEYMRLPWLATHSMVSGGGRLEAGVAER